MGVFTFATLAERFEPAVGFQECKDTFFLSPAYDGRVVVFYGNPFRFILRTLPVSFLKAVVGFAFSDKQFDEMMGKWGLDPEKDLDKIYRIPGGGFIQKKDHKHFHEVLDRHNAEMEAAKAADEDGTGFLYQMFKYELDNHEYGYTGELEDTLDCLGLTWEELKASPVMLKALDKASTEIREREGC